MTARDIAEQIAPVYVEMGWKWRSGRPPYVEEIEARIIELERDLGKDPGDYIETGRLRLQRDGMDGGVDVLLSIDALYGDGA